MRARRLLYLNAHRLTAYYWRSGEFREEASFTSAENSLEQFTEYLRQRTGSQFHLLTNPADEGYTAETIPFLRGADRQALIKRKAEQLYFGTPYAITQSLGYEKTTRKNERILLTALTNPAYLEPWLRCFALTEAPLAGVYTVAQLAAPLLKKIHRPVERCLMLSVQDNSIRESYVVSGLTQFSRIAHISDSSIAGIASALAAEAGKLHQYLIGQRLLGRNEHLPVHVLAHPLSLGAVRSACIDSANLTFDILDNHLAASQMGCKTFPQDNRSELLFLQILAVAPPRHQFAGEELRHHFRISQIQQAILAVGAIALIAALLFSAKQGYQGHVLEQEAQEFLIRSAELDQRYQGISATFPKLGINGDTLRLITTRHNEVAASQRLPDKTWLLISGALAAAPAVDIERIDWKRLGKTASVAFSEEQTSLKGSLRLPPQATPREAVAEFEKFTAKLGEAPGVTVTVKQQPVEIESSHALRGGTQEDEAAAPRTFSLILTRRVSP